MKFNLLLPLLLMLVIGLGACQKEDVEANFFSIEEQYLSHSWNSMASSVTIPVTTNLPITDWEAISDASGWLTADKEKKYTDSYLTISVSKNNSGFVRTGHVTVNAPGYTALITVIQKADKNVVVAQDLLIRPVSGKASEYQPGQNIENTWDGKFASGGAAPYHSVWNQSAKFPVTLEYYFNPNTEIDYLIYYTRSGNGNFGKVNIYLSDDPARKQYKFYKSCDFKMQNAPSKVTFNGTRTVTAIKFEVESGLGNFVSCDEMEFYKYSQDNNLEKQLLAVFTDITCTALKTGVTADQINALPTYFINLAEALKNNTYDSYEKQFRIRAYEPYSHVEEWAEKLMTKKYGNLDNPTGISVKEGDEIIVLVGDTHGQDITLQSIWESKGEYAQTNVNGQVYFLKPGVNKIAITRQGQLFVMYNTDLTSPAAKPVTIHIPLGSGQVTGFFDLKEHKTDQAYAQLLSKAKHKYFCIRGEKIMFYFHTAKLRELVPNEILSAIHLWDNIIGWQQELMGIEDVRPVQVNNHIFAISPEGSYMWATDYCIGFVYTYLNNILLEKNVMSAKDNAWGPSHEIGHIHQAAIDWPGSTESSNNLFSNYILYKLGKYCSRGTELCMPKVDDNIRKQTLIYTRFLNNRPWWDFGEGHQGENTELHMRMNWQLWNYYHRCGKNKEFWPTLFRLMRDNRISSSNPGDKQMLFARMAARAAQEDLTEFFEMWGFFVETDVQMNQYGSYHYVVTQAMIDETKEYMKQFSRKAAPFYYLEDRKAGDTGLDTRPSDVGYYQAFIDNTKISKTVTATISGKEITIHDGDEAVAFEIYKDDKRVYFSTYFTFEVPESVGTGGIELKAVQTDGARIPIHIKVQ